MAVKQLKPKSTSVVDYDAQDVERGVQLADAARLIRENLNMDDYDSSDLPHDLTTAMPKMAIYQSEYGSEEAGLVIQQDGEYGSLEVVMNPQMGRPDYLTANIPESADLAYNEAYLDDKNSEFKADFIRLNNLGRVVPQHESNVRGYMLVVFDMDRLAEFDPVGYEKYMTQMDAIGRIPRVNSQESIGKAFVDGVMIGARQASIEQQQAERSELTVQESPELTTPERSELAVQQAKTRLLPSVAYDMGLVDMEVNHGDSSRRLPSVGEELMMQQRESSYGDFGE